MSKAAFYHCIVARIEAELEQQGCSLTNYQRLSMIETLARMDKIASSNTMPLQFNNEWIPMTSQMVR